MWETRRQYKNLYRPMQSLFAIVMAVNLQRGGERTVGRDTGGRWQKQRQHSVFEHRLAYCKPVCSIGLSSNGLSSYINATPVNLGYSKYTEHSWFVMTTQNKNVLLIFALVCVTATKRNMSVILGFWGKKENSDMGQNCCLYILVWGICVLYM